jgi:hypothetical protein
MGCWQCLPLSVIRLKGKHCRKPHCCNGVVDTFGHIYNMKNQFWAGLGSRVELMKKSLGPIMSNFLEQFFFVFLGKKLV